MIKFVQEPTGWKVDGTTVVNEPKFRPDGREATFDVSSLPAEMLQELGQKGTDDRRL